MYISICLLGMTPFIIRIYALSCRIGPYIFQRRIQSHSPNNVTCKKLIFRETKQLRKLQLSDPALLLNTATEVPREAATTGNLLVENLQVEYPVNFRTPHLIWEKIRAHLFLHHWQMFTKGRLHIFHQ